MYKFQSTVYDDVFNKGMTLTAEQPVQLIGVGQKMSIMGFVPCSPLYVDYLSGTLALSSSFHDITNLAVKYANENPALFKLSRMIRRLGKEKLLVDSYLDFFEYSQRYAHLEWFKSFRKRLAEGASIGEGWMKCCSTAFVKEDDKIWYLSDGDNFLFSLYEGRNISVASSFLCLCAYTNPVKGNVEYQVFNPTELVRIDNL